MNIILNPWIAFGFNAVLYFLWILTIARILPRRCYGWRYWLTQLAGLVAYFLSPLLPFLSNFRFQYGLLVMIVSTLVLYGGKWYFRVIVTVLTMMATVFSELMLWFVVPEGWIYQMLEGDPAYLTLDIQAYMCFLLLFMSGILLLALFLICRMIRSRHSGDALSKQSLLFLLFPFSQYAALAAGPGSGRDRAALRRGGNSARLRISPVLDGCRNTVVASYLHWKQAELERKGLGLDCHMALPAHLEIQDMDLICAFGNLLDNAEEACAGPGQRIELSAAMRGVYLTIRVSNALEERSEAAKPRRIPELSRGIGHTILQQMAERYDGEFRSGAEGARYVATLILRADVETGGSSPAH